MIQVQEQVDELLAKIGVSEILSVPYDTSWLARLSLQMPEFQGAYKWLEQHQHEDGSWGSDTLHYHDRVVNTLAAVVALRLNSQTNPMIVKRGVEYLRNNIGNLHQDANDSVNFVGTMSLLLEEAASLGIHIEGEIDYRHDKTKKRLQALSTRPDLWLNNPISFSLECLHPSLPEAEMAINCFGSIAGSPSATAAVLINSRQKNARLIEYLKSIVNPDLGAPALNPINVFQIAWCLTYLRQANLVTPNQPYVRNALEYLKSIWDVERGVGMSMHGILFDLDDTASVYTLLTWGGYNISPMVFGSYEEADHFHCYKGETDPSLSVHIRLVIALRQNPDVFSMVQPWICKALSFVHDYYASHTIWTDKWHMSPLYLSEAAIRVLDCQAASTHIEWVLKNQNIDGGWGYYGNSTLEETAYATNALTYWESKGHILPDSALKTAYTYLNTHFDEPPAELWIGKSLYAPTRIIRANVLAAIATCSRSIKGNRYDRN